MMVMFRLLLALTGWLLLWHKAVHRSTLWHGTRCIIVGNTAGFSCSQQHTQQLENIGSRIDMQTHAGSNSKRP